MERSISVSSEVRDFPMKCEVVVAVPNLCESHCLNMLGELKECSRVDVLAESQGWISDRAGNAAAVFADLAEYEDVVFDESLQRCVIRFSEFFGHWCIDEPDFYLAGEFKLIDLYSSIVKGAPKLAWEGSSDDERRLFSEFRVIDDHPRGGTGTLVALRIQPGVTSPEVWLYDGVRGSVKLDVDYCGYIDALLVTKGTYGWQYLFADISLAEDEYSSFADDMRQMLDIFPELFPDYDYAPLEERLAQRLRR